MSNAIHGRAATTHGAVASLIAIAAALALAGCGNKETPAQTAAATKDGQVLVRAKNVRWGDAPPGLPAGAKAALLQGDPSGEGVYVIRLKLPAKYKVGFHSLPKAHNINVLSGTLYVATTASFDKKKALPIRPGDFYRVPASVQQLLFTQDETIVEVFGEGPLKIKYASTADDPLKGAAAPEYKFPEGYKDNELTVTEAEDAVNLSY